MRRKALIPNDKGQIQEISKLRANDVKTNSNNSKSTKPKVTKVAVVNIGGSDDDSSSFYKCCSNEEIKSSEKSSQPSVLNSS